ncbi:MAG TPA: hypothetical protein VGP93_05945, partial [Polyangiaceae bacterium]|nr:hypothetical protein [Polyangiaceae bacterium]
EYLPYQTGQPIPQGYYLESGVRRGPVIAGSIVLAVPYVFGVAFTDLDQERVWLIVPVIGPWVTMANTDYSCTTSPTSASYSFDCDTRRAGRTLLILDGLMQATGAALLIYGIASPRERLVRQDLYRGLVVTPQFSASGGGILARGEF